MQFVNIKSNMNTRQYTWQHDQNYFLLSFISSHDDLLRADAVCKYLLKETFAGRDGHVAIVSCARGGNVNIIGFYLH